jgi:hypothetical protein
MSDLLLLQLNVIVEKDSGGFGFFDNISEDSVVIPFGWIEEGVLGPSDVRLDDNLFRII